MALNESYGGLIGIQPELQLVNLQNKVKGTRTTFCHTPLKSFFHVVLSCFKKHPFLDEQNGYSQADPSRPVRLRTPPTKL